MMKGTPCSRGNYAPLKTSSKTRISIEVQGLGPWRGLGQRPNLACFIGQWFGCWVCPTHNTNPAKRVRAWAPSEPLHVGSPRVPSTAEAEVDAVDLSTKLTLAEFGQLRCR